MVKYSIIVLFLLTFKLVDATEFRLILGGAMSQAYGSKDQAVEYNIAIKAFPVMRAGFSATHPIANDFFLVQEVLYSPKGSNQNISVKGQPVNFDLRYDLDYLEVPILLKYNILKIKNLSIESLVGLSFSYLLKAYYDLDGIVQVGDDAIPLQESYEMKDLDEFDYSLLYGFSTNLKQLGIPVDLEYRFSLSWYKINFPTFQEVEPVRLSNQSHALTFSYKFWN